MKRYRRESTLKDDVIKYLKERYGRDIWFYKSSDLFTKGIPDILICFFGAFVAIELKRNAQTDAEPLQKINIKKICEANGFAFVASSVEEIKLSLERIRAVVENKS